MSTLPGATNHGGPGRILSPVALVVAVVLFVAIGSSLSFIEVRALDMLFSLMPARSPDPHVALINAEDEDPSLYARFRQATDDGPDVAKVPRRAYAELTRRLNRWGAKVIVFDLWFARACSEKSGEDRALAEAFAKAGNVIVAATTKVKPGAVSLQDPIDAVRRSVWAVGSPAAYSPNETVRSVAMMVRDDETGLSFYALSALAWSCFLGARRDEIQIDDGRSMTVKGRRVPLRPGERISLVPWTGSRRAETPQAEGIKVESGEVKAVSRMQTWNVMQLNWCGPGGTIAPLQLVDVLDMSDADGRERFDGRAVIVGRMSWDEHWTGVGAMPGPEIQATALHTLISERFVRPLNSLVFLLLAAAFCTAAALLVRRFSGGRSLAASLGLAIVAVVLAWQLLAHGIWMYWFICVLGIALSWGMTTLFVRGAVAALLGRFVPEFLKGRHDQHLGEVRTMDASILFSDIRGFTTTAEQLGPEKMLHLLHMYHSSVEDIITKHGGTIIKTPGDAVVAVFWNERKGRSHAACALQAGREVLADVPRLAGAWEDHDVKLAIGVGINAGEVAIGFVGKHHLEPTVIGDAVNVAARLESLTKSLNYPLIFSEALRERLDEPVEADCLDEVTVSGRQAAIIVYGLHCA